MILHLSCSTVINGLPIRRGGSAGWLAGWPVGWLTSRLGSVWVAVGQEGPADASCLPEEEEKDEHAAQGATFGRSEPDLWFCKLPSKCGLT